MKDEQSILKDVADWHLHIPRAEFEAQTRSELNEPFKLDY